MMEVLLLLLVVVVVGGEDRCSSQWPVSGARVDLGDSTQQVGGKAGHIQSGAQEPCQLIDSWVTSVAILRFTEWCAILSEYTR